MWDCKKFEEICGRLPEQDDLDRVNCKETSIGHEMCGICLICGMPNFVCGGAWGHTLPKQQKDIIEVEYDYNTLNLTEYLFKLFEEFAIDPYRDYNFNAVSQFEYRLSQLMKEYIGFPNTDRIRCSIKCSARSLMAQMIEEGVFIYD